MNCWYLLWSDWWTHFHIFRSPTTHNDCSSGSMIYLSLRSLSSSVVRNAFSSTDTSTYHVLLYFPYSNPHQNESEKKRECQNKRMANNARLYAKCNWVNSILGDCWPLLLYSPMAPCNYHNFSLCLHFLRLNLHSTGYNRIDLKSDYRRSNCTCNTTTWTLSVLCCKINEKRKRNHKWHLESLCLD